MIRLKRILVPTDFSETSQAAVQYGVEMARGFKAELHLLNVPEHPGEAAEAEYPIGLFENMQNAAYDRLSKLLTDEEARSVPVSFTMRIGTPYDEIVRYAVEREIDLIVMGTHGRKGIAHAVMGSVAEKVVRKAPCPVLTIHHPEREFIVPEKPTGRSAGAAA
jgi:nucleotide-binding universal stress UspA family protein